MRFANSWLPTTPKNARHDDRALEDPCARSARAAWAVSSRQSIARSGAKVAIKILHPVYSRMPEVVARFRMEARAASQINHPNIIEVTDSGTTVDGLFYFVMELLEGRCR